MANAKQWWPSGWGQDFTYPNLSEYQRLSFDSDPSVAYSYVTRPAQTYGGTGFRSYLSRMGPEYYNRYVSDFATGHPTQATDFYDWMAGSGRFKPYEDFLKLSPYERGERQSAFAGRARWVL